MAWYTPPPPCEARESHRASCLSKGSIHRLGQRSKESEPRKREPKEAAKNSSEHAPDCNYGRRWVSEGGSRPTTADRWTLLTAAVYSCCISRTLFCSSLSLQISSLAFTTTTTITTAAVAAAPCRTTIQDSRIGFVSHPRLFCNVHTDLRHGDQRASVHPSRARFLNFCYFFVRTSRLQEHLTLSERRTRADGFPCLPSLRGSS